MLTPPLIGMGGDGAKNGRVASAESVPKHTTPANSQDEKLGKLSLSRICGWQDLGILLPWEVTN